MNACMYTCVCASLSSELITLCFSQIHVAVYMYIMFFFVHTAASQCLSSLIYRLEVPGLHSYMYMCSVVLGGVVENSLLNFTWFKQFVHVLDMCDGLKWGRVVDQFTVLKEDTLIKFAV